MPAYLRSIVGQCFHPGCTKQAVVALFNGQNAKIGDYCKRHGEAALKHWREKVDGQGYQR